MPSARRSSRRARRDVGRTRGRRVKAFTRGCRRISSRRGRITQRRGAAFEHAAERALGLVEGAAAQQGGGAGVRGRVVVAPLGHVVVVGVTPLADAQRAAVEFDSRLPRPIGRDGRAVVRREVDFASALLPFGPRFDEFRARRSGPCLWYRELERAVLSSDCSVSR